MCEVDIKGLRGSNGEFGALGVVTVPGDADATHAFIADVARQPEWSPGVKAATVEELADGTKAVHQVLTWSFLALRGDMHLRLLQREDAGARGITTQLQSGTMMRSFRSSVSVTEAGPGMSRVEMQLFMAPAIFVPPLVRAMVGAQVRRQLRGVLAALAAFLTTQDKAAAAAATAAADAAPDAAAAAAADAAPAWAGSDASDCGAAAGPSSDAGDSSSPGDAGGSDDLASAEEDNGPCLGAAAAAGRKQKRGAAPARPAPGVLVAA
ncbi:hypothetical protein Rsub_08446 [Raphidocelis subcapitata]|uniref:Coenzyme Q-binding protein COQ10 START domain-containing protein n=1 Tax=Raphidocelis subcapitata TaxID=307507 RepID=A0A2V0PFL2_9CHLO|nr:hypothetical protein Rsub_08446 [Raphidocelis subcapitata]|eukprot:GBF95855.1 hypothetical protein Rsub_08446 [Raphidocelis subcapitata]